MVRPTGWSGCGSSPTVLPSRRRVIIGRKNGIAFESKLTTEPLGRKGAAPARQNGRGDVQIVTHKLGITAAVQKEHGLRPFPNQNFTFVAAADRFKCVPLVIG